jgi:hypothetical protein
MKVKKLDLSGVKNFLFHKGERVAVVVCAALAVVFIGVGIMNATSARKPFDQEFKRAANNISQRIRDDGKVDPPKEVAAPPLWQEVAENFPDHQPLIIVGNGGDENKRRNPTILKIDEDPKHIQIEFLRGGYYSFELDKTKETVMAFGGDKGPAGAGNNPAAGLTKIMKPARFIMVSAVFPMKAQVAEYRKQLRYPPDQDLKPEDWPHPVGLNVWRYEVVGDKWSDPQPLYFYNARDEKFEVAERLANLYKEAYIDEETPNAFGPQIYHGLTTPLPSLANIHYPKTNLKDITEDLEMFQKRQIRNIGGGRGGPRGNWSQKPRPGVQGNEAALPTPAPLPWKKLSSPQLQDKFAGKIDYFDPTGILLPEDVLNPAIPQAPGIVRPPGTLRRPRIGTKGGGTVTKDDVADALVRFIDVDVEVGKTYRYLFEVRFANPNFEKKDDVLYQALAEEKELVSLPSSTPPITVSDEYFWYAVDKKPDNPIPQGSDERAAREGKETAVQIHRWVGKIANTDKAVADWAIAERLLVRRGDAVGRFNVMVEVPVYDKLHDTLEIGFEAQPIDKKLVQKRAHTGLPINFILEKDTNSPPLLVDFEGGEKKNQRVGTVTVPRDESAVDVLVLTPDNKLVVRNSRLDSDPEYPPAHERIERYETWLKTIRDLRNADPGAGKKKTP